jgi:putative NADH-flavin reductase
MAEEKHPMNVVLYGATGMIGSRILQELLTRGHKVTAVVRDPSRVPANANVKAVKGDQTDAADVAAKTKGADAIITAYSPGPDAVTKVLDATRSLIAGAKQAGVKRVIMVGGAGSLFVAPGVDLIDSGHLPDEWKAIAIAHRDALKILRESNLDWTSLSPAAFIQPGERTGKFRLGTDNLVADEQHQSKISAEDYAVALVDELEQPKHIRQRFTLAY